jgi:PAS domain S-box-containing protein
MAQKTGTSELIPEDETRAYLSAIVESSDDAIFSKTLDGIINSWNRGAEILYGYTAAEAIGQPVSFLVPPERLDELQQITERIQQGERVEHLETVRVAKDGGRIFVSLTLSPIFGADHRIVGVSAIARDITERIRMEQSLPSIQVIARDINERKRVDEVRESVRKELAFERARFESVVRQIPIGVLIAEAPTGRLVYDNEQSRHIFRQEFHQVAGFADYGQWKIYRLDGSPMPIEECPLVRALGGETVIDEELQIGRGDGTQGFVSVTATPIRDALGEIVSGLAAFIDITASKTSAKALSDSEERLNLALDAAEMGWCDIDVRSAQGLWSRRHFQVLGYPTSESGSAPATTDMWLSRIHPDDREQVTRGLETARQEHVFFRSEHRIIRVDNEQVVWVNVQGRFICDPSGTACRFLGVIYDVSERKASEEALRNSESTLKLAVETTGLGIFDLDLRTGKGIWSDIAKRHYGLPPQEDADLAVLMSGVHPEDRERMEQIARDAQKPEGTGVYSAEYRTVGIRDGKLRWLSMRGRVSFDEQGGPERLVGACLDITEIVEAEKALKDEITERLRAVEELRRQEQLLIRQGRLAAMGEMIGNIAHQWRQPLNTLGLIVQELPRYYQSNLFTLEYLDASVTRAMQVINYMSKTIDGFRNFFGPDKEKEAFKASEVLAKTVSIVEAAFKELNMEIEVSADDDIVIYGCPNEFSQVILNILVNAKDAILERRVANPKVVLLLFRENGRLVLTLADNAGGIAPEIIDRIFDPYFTTKSPDKGTGIGLFMSKTIIEKNMNGTLTVRNTAEGAEFRIEV